MFLWVDSPKCCLVKIEMTNELIFRIFAAKILYKQNYHSL